MDSQQLLGLLMDRPIAFQRSFVRLGIGVTGALFLSQAVYWSNRTSDQKGWFYKTKDEWEDETGMTRYEQERARKILKSLGFLEETKKGVPAKLFYKVNFSELYSALSDTVRELTLEEVLRIYENHINNIAKTGYMRAKKTGVYAEKIDYKKILQEKGMVCGICKDKILRGPGQFGGMLAFDHIVCIESGGEHTKSNIQPAHAACTSRKSKENHQFAMTQQTRMRQFPKQGCDSSPNKDAIVPQTITETTAEITTENKTLCASTSDAPEERLAKENHSQQEKPWLDDGKLTEGFDIFWQAGMRKDTKQASKKKFSALCKKGKYDPLGFGQKIADDVKKKIEARIIESKRPGGLLPLTYLNQQRWEDAPGDEDAECPHEELLNLFDEAMPSHVPRTPRTIWSPGLDAYHSLANIWRDGFNKTDGAGNVLYKTREEGLDFWRRAFEYAAASPFLMGGVWFDLEWLVKHNHFIDMLRQKYHRELTG